MSNQNQGASIEAASRAEFEAEVRDLDLPADALARWPDGRYLQEPIESMWSGWQMARRTPAATTGDGERSLLDRLRERNPEFVAHLERNAAEVATWPKWKTGLWASDASAGDGELPPLPPEELLCGDPNIGDDITGYTAEQMRDYARAAIEADRAQRQVAPASAQPAGGSPQAELLSEIGHALDLLADTKMTNSTYVTATNTLHHCRDALLGRGYFGAQPADPVANIYWDRDGKWQLEMLCEPVVEQGYKLPLVVARDGWPAVSPPVLWVGDTEYVAAGAQPDQRESAADGSLAWGNCQLYRGAVSPAAQPAKGEQ